MSLQTDRIVGLSIATLGLLLLFVIFPIAIEDIEGGSIQPNTLPNALAGFLVVCGIIPVSYTHVTLPTKRIV